MVGNDKKPERDWMGVIGDASRRVWRSDDGLTFIVHFGTLVGGVILSVVIGAMVGSMVGVLSGATYYAKERACRVELEHVVDACTPCVGGGH